MPEIKDIETNGKEDSRTAHFIGPLVLMTLIVMVGTVAYEAAIHLVFPDMTTWESHAMTIAFTGAIIAVIVYCMLCRQKELHRNTIEELAERRRAEKLLREAERVRVLAETAGAAAHEINQPLSILLGTIELMLDAGPEDDHREQLAALREAAQRIDAIVRKMGAAQQYATKPYIDNLYIVDFEGASQGQRNEN